MFFYHKMALSDEVNVPQVNLSRDVFEVDLYIAFTDGAKRLLPTSAELAAQHDVDKLNSILENSGIYNVFFKLVDVQEIDSDEFELASSSLQKLDDTLNAVYDCKIKLKKNGTCLPDSVKLAHADTLIVYTDYIQDNAIGTSNGKDIIILGKAASATTFAHEIGHNMGLMHTTEDAVNAGKHKYAAGYGVTGLFATIMSYPSVFNTNERLFVFSNPYFKCLGEPCGDANIANAAKHIILFGAERLGNNEEPRAKISKFENINYQQIEGSYLSKTRELERMIQKLRMPIHDLAMLCNNTSVLNDAENECTDNDVESLSEVKLAQYNLNKLKTKIAIHNVEKYATDYNSVINEIGGNLQSIISKCTARQCNNEELKAYVKYDMARYFFQKSRADLFSGLYEPK
ncbi:reprolysin-like metallopeptidase [Aeromonas aquatilis]